MPHSPTDEQTAILNAATGTSKNLMIQALAGCGKSSTLEMIARNVKASPILYVAFGKRNVEEAVERMPSHVAVKTLNSIGHRIWSEGISKNKISVSDKKVGRIFKEVADSLKGSDRDDMWSMYHEIITGVAIAKAVGYVPEGKFPSAKRLMNWGAFNAELNEPLNDFAGDLLDEILKRSIVEAFDGSIDFNDQVYMPAIFGGPAPRFPLVMVDEYQDLSPVNHALVAMLVRKRLIAVGDRHQNIYAFRGAKASGMIEAKETYSMEEFPLSISFRCPEAIVAHARKHVPEFKSLKPGGEVHFPDSLAITSIPPEASILCRLNAPLFAMGLRLLSAGKSCQVVGKDIGPRLTKIMSKLGHESMTQKETLSAIADWEAERLEAGSKIAGDMAASMRVFAGHTSTLGHAIQYATHLFKAEGHIKLMTGHKAKGLEFENVYHLDPQLCGKSSQDQNLWYVITTRSQNSLTEIASANIEDD